MLFRKNSTWFIPSRPKNIKQKLNSILLHFNNSFNALHSLQLFEGMKAYRGADDRIRIFRPNMNMNRMNLSAKRSGLPTFDGEELIACLNRLISIDQEWVPHTNTASLYIRPTLIGIDVSPWK